MSENLPRNQELEIAAIRAAREIPEKLALNPRDQFPIGIILGTGWGNVLEVTDARPTPMSTLPGFRHLGQLAGHNRSVFVGTVGEKRVIGLSGRVHLNEAPHDPEIPKMVRLQTEMLLQLGVHTLIVTSAVGSLSHDHPDDLRVCDVAVIDGFVTLFAGPMPLWAGEFCNPEDTLDPGLRRLALEAGQKAELRLKEVGHVMVPGPHFEGRKYDKPYLARSNASVVGMSMLPEACIAALYGAKVLGLGFVTDDDVEEMSHEKHQARAREASDKLGKLLTHIIASLP